MSKEIETTKPETIEAQVAAWSATDAALKAAVEATQGITVAGHAEGPKKGRQAVHDAAMTLANLRTPIEARRKELKRPILDLGNLVDSEAKRLTEILLPRETELRADRDAYDAEQKRIKDAADWIERERLEAEAKAKREAEAAEAERIRAEALERLADRVKRISAAGGVPDAIWLTTAGDDEVASLISRLEREKADREAVAELERIEREKAEAAEKIRREEQARKDEETRKEREAAEAAARAEREAQEAKDRAERAEADRLAKIEQERIAAANKAEADRLAAERAEFARVQEEARIAAQKAEDARIEAERAEREANEEAERIERERIEAEREAARIAAEAPDREKALAWLRVIVLPALPDIQSEAIRDRLEQVRDDIAMAIFDAKHEMENAA